MNQIATDDGKLHERSLLQRNVKLAASHFYRYSFYLLKTQQRARAREGKGGEGKEECLPGSVYVKVIDMQID